MRKITLYDLLGNREIGYFNFDRGPLDGEVPRLKEGSTIHLHLSAYRRGDFTKDYGETIQATVINTEKRVEGKAAENSPEQPDEGSVILCSAAVSAGCRARKEIEVVFLKKRGGIVLFPDEQGVTLMREEIPTPEDAIARQRVLAGISTLKDGGLDLS